MPPHRPTVSALAALGQRAPAPRGGVENAAPRRRGPKRLLGSFFSFSEQTLRGIRYDGGTNRSVIPRARVQCAAFNLRQARQKLEEEEEFPPEAEEEEADEEEGGADAEAEDGEAGEASLEEILTKKPEERPAPDEEEDEESILSLGREERIETLSVKVVPPDPAKEFTCRKCYLVKHRSQLADKKRMYCRDCV